jgi:hypothetical protein
LVQYPLWILLVVFSNVLNPDKHNITTPYFHLLSFLQHVAVVPFAHRQLE